MVAVCKSCHQDAWVQWLLSERKRRGILEVEKYGEKQTKEPPIRDVQWTTEDNQDGTNARVRKDSLKVFMFKLKGAAELFEDAVREGAFNPWIKETKDNMKKQRASRVLDLHDMSVDVAKVAVYSA